jgi:hypothetical protein
MVLGRERGALSGWRQEESHPIVVAFLMTNPTKLLVAIVALIFAVVVIVTRYIPLTESTASTPPFTVDGTVIARTLDPSHTVGNPAGRRRVTNGLLTEFNNYKTLDQYLIDVRLDNGEVVRGTWPGVIDNIPIGQRVSVTCQRRNLPRTGQMTMVLNIALLTKPAQVQPRGK